MQLFVNQLTNVDFSYLDAARGLVGETWLASAVLDGALDQQGMVCDFGIVKKTLRNWLDDEVDHRLLVPTDSTFLQLEEQGDRIKLTWQSEQGAIHMSAPREAVALVEAETITAASVAEWCRQQLKPFFPVNVDQLTLSFEPEIIPSAFYHYSHGLKKHAGNCQRIAHGHRSRLHIWLDDQPAPDQEQRWANRWADIYIGSQEDLISETDTDMQFAYQSAQGQFSLNVPKSTCYMIDTDSTVEWIAEHIASELAQEYPNQQIRVQAFEGINKGAFAMRHPD